MPHIKKNNDFKRQSSPLSGAKHKFRLYFGSIREAKAVVFCFDNVWDCRYTNNRKIRYELREIAKGLGEVDDESND